MSNHRGHVTTNTPLGTTTGPRLRTLVALQFRRGGQLQSQTPRLLSKFIHRRDHACLSSQRKRLAHAPVSSLLHGEKHSQVVRV